MPDTNSGDATGGRSLEGITWHIDRYDRLRTSTANRASAVLSAAAILSAGDAVLLTQFPSLSTSAQRPGWLLPCILLSTLASSVFVVVALFNASSVLATRRPTARVILADIGSASAFLFNGTETVKRASTFVEFRRIMYGQTDDDSIAAAELELWIGIRQHRIRYVRLRAAVRTLQSAAGFFLAALIVFAVDQIANALHLWSA